MFSKSGKLQSLLEAVPDALVAVDQSGVIWFANRRTELLFGHQRADLVGQGIAMLVPEFLWQFHLPHRERQGADTRSAAAGPDLNLSGRHQDGRVFPIGLSLSALDTGDVLLVVHPVSEMTSSGLAFENAQRMAAIVQHSDDAIIANTLGGVILSWNPAAKRMYGYSSKEAIGRSVDLLAPGDRAGEMIAILAKIKAGQAVDHFETVRVRSNGTAFPVSISVSPIREESGQVVGASSIARDVTEHRAAYEMARVMIESSQDSLVSISAEGKITDANAATVIVTGVPREELIGTAFSDYFTDPEKASTIYQRVFAEGTAMDYPLTLRHRDGTLTDVLYNASVHRGAAGNVLAVFAAARDMTRLSEAYEAARSMIESSLDSMVAISPDGKITDVNEATIKVTGVPRETLVGTAFSDYFTDPEMANRIYQLVFADGMAVDYPLTMRHRDGTETEVLYNAAVYRSARGEVLGAFAAARDVTKQNQARREIAEQQASERARLWELEQFQRLTVGRELQMIELKKEIEYLREFAPDDSGDSDEQR